MKPWFRVEAAVQDPTVADIYVIDFIGGWIEEYWGDNQGVITAKAFVEALGKLPDSVKTIRLHVNSPGGDVFAATQMANALRDQRASKGRRVEALVEGLAASAASIVIMAGDSIVMADNALLFIHNPCTGAVGYAKDLRKTADELDTIRATIIATYQWHSTLDETAIAGLMEAESWLDADQAIEHGFATEKVEGLRAAALLDPKAVATLKVPDQYRARVEAFLEKPAPPPAPEPPAAAAADVLRLCREAGVLDLAETLVTEAVTLEAAQARIGQEQSRRAEATARAEHITALCTQATVPDLAAGYIRGAMSIDDVRQHLVTVTALRDDKTIDGSLSPEQRAMQRADLSASAIYATRNRLTKE